MVQIKSNVCITTNSGPQIFGSDRSDRFRDAKQPPLRGIM